MNPTTRAVPAELLNLVQHYLWDTGKSASWLGYHVAGDTRLVPNLRRGQAYPAETMLRLLKRLGAHFYQQLEAEKRAAA